MVQDREANGALMAAQIHKCVKAVKDPAVITGVWIMGMRSVLFRAATICLIDLYHEILHTTVIEDYRRNGPMTGTLDNHSRTMTAFHHDHLKVNRIDAKGPQARLHIVMTEDHRNTEMTDDLLRVKAVLVMSTHIYRLTQVLSLMKGGPPADRIGIANNLLADMTGIVIGIGTGDETNMLMKHSARMAR